MYKRQAQYRTNYATVGGSYSVADGYEQAMLTARGNIVAHPQAVSYTHLDVYKRQ